MRKVIQASALAIAVSLGVPQFAHANLNDALANICTIVSADDKAQLRKKIISVQNDYNLKLRDYYSGVSCGGNSLIRAAITNNSVKVGTLLVKKMPSKALQSPEKDGKTLQAWISENGHSENPIATALASRI